MSFVIFVKCINTFADNTCAYVTFAHFQVSSPNKDYRLWEHLDVYYMQLVFLLNHGILSHMLNSGDSDKEFFFFPFSFSKSSTTRILI